MKYLNPKIRSFSLLSFILFIFSVSLIISCKKYPDGPLFSLRSKLSRITNIWTIDQYFIDDVDQTSAVLNGYYDNTFQMTKDSKYSDNWNSYLVPFSDGGTWGFIENKDAVRLVSGLTGVADTLTILRLKNTEFWVKKRNGSQNIIIHYKKH